MECYSCHLTAAAAHLDVSFSPLFIAVWNVTSTCNRKHRRCSLSVRFSSRYGMLLHKSPVRRRCVCIFQSAFHRGMECYQSTNCVPAVISDFQSAFHRGMECYLSSCLGSAAGFSGSFSPLFIAVWNVTSNRLPTVDSYFVTFSPLFIAVWNVTGGGVGGSE